MRTVHHLANKIRTLKARIDETGKSRLEELKKHHGSLQELISEYSRKPDNYFTRVELLKKLNRIALKVQAAHASGKIKEEIEFFDKALLALKKFRFKAADEALQELSPLISMAEEHELLLSEYRKKYTALQNRKLNLMEKISEIETKQALFKTEACSEEEYSAFNSRLQSYNTSIADLMSDFIAKAQSRKAISIMLDIYGNPELALPPPPKQAEVLKRFLVANEVGKANVSQLIDMSRHSRERLQYYLDDVKAFLEVVAPNLPWLESLNSLKFTGALQIDLDNSADDLKIKIPKIISAVNSISRQQNINCESQINFLRELRKAAINGNFDKVRARYFQNKEEASAKIKSGEEIKILREELNRIEEMLSTLPEPNELDRR